MATEREIPEVGEEIHLPGPSAQPLLLALFTTIAVIGLTPNSPVYFIFGTVGALWVLACGSAMLAPSTRRCRIITTTTTRLTEPARRA